VGESHVPLTKAQTIKKQNKRYALNKGLQNQTTSWKKTRLLQKTIKAECETMGSRQSVGMMAKNIWKNE